MTHEQAVQLFRIMNTIVQTVVPAWLITRFRVRGFFIAVVFFWLFGVLTDLVVESVYPGGMQALAHAIWAYTGWLFSFIAVGLIALVTFPFILIVREIQRRSSVNGPEQPVAAEAQPAKADDEFPIRTYFRTRFLRTLPRLHPFERIGLTLVILYVLALIGIVMKII